MGIIRKWAYALIALISLLCFLGLLGLFVYQWVFGFNCNLSSHGGSCNGTVEPVLLVGMMLTLVLAVSMVVMVYVERRRAGD